MSKKHLVITIFTSLLFSLVCCRREDEANPPITPVQTWQGSPQNFQPPPPPPARTQAEEKETNSFEWPQIRAIKKILGKSFRYTAQKSSYEFSYSSRVSAITSEYIEVEYEQCYMDVRGCIRYDNDTNRFKFRFEYDGLPIELDEAENFYSHRGTIRIPRNAKYQVTKDSGQSIFKADSCGKSLGKYNVSIYAESAHIEVTKRSTDGPWSNREIVHQLCLNVANGVDSYELVEALENMFAR